MANVQAQDVYGIAGQPLPDQLKVQARPLLSQGVDFKSLGDTYNSAYTNAMQFGQMNPEVVLNALKDGGTLSNSFGFSSPNQVSGMTPELFAAMFKDGGAGDALTKAKTTLDTVSNAPEIRQRLGHLADQQYQAGLQALHQQNSQDLQAQIANAGHASTLAGHQANLNQQADITNAQLDQTKHLHDETLANQLKTTKMHIASSERIANQSNARLIDQMNLQVKMHNQTIAAQLGMSAANHAATLTEGAAKQIETAVLHKEHTAAGTEFVNQTLIRHPELNQGFYYDYDPNWFSAGGKMLPAKLTPHVVGNEAEAKIAGVPIGTAVWLKGTKIFSLRK